MRQTTGFGQEYMYGRVCFSKRYNLTEASWKYSFAGLFRDPSTTKDLSRLRLFKALLWIVFWFGSIVVNFEEVFGNLGNVVTTAPSSEKTNSPTWSFLISIGVPSKNAILTMHMSSQSICKIVDFLSLNDNGSHRVLRFPASRACREHCKISSDL